MTRTAERAAGLALLALLAVHPLLRPEGGWALLSTCDIAAFATAIGLLAGAYRIVTTAFLFQLIIGLPALAIGILTTYRANASGIAIHIVPLVLGGVVAAREGLPRRAALYAWSVYAVSIAFAAALAPADLNINFATKVWPPLSGALSLHVFQLCLVAVVAVMLAGGELVLRRFMPP